MSLSDTPITLFTEPPLPRWTWFLLVALVSCNRRHVTIRVAIPGPDSLPYPVPGVALVALPYDRDSIIAALDARAPTPRPPTRELDSLFQAFRTPFTQFARISYRILKLRDSLATLKQRLDSLPRNAPEYQELYLRFGRQADSLSALTAIRVKAESTLGRARKTLIPRIDKLRGPQHDWEASVRRDYSSITTQITTVLGRDPLGDSSRADGRASLTLGPGPWWIYAFTWDASDPYAEWYWNLPVRGDSLVLDATTGKRRPKY